MRSFITVIACCLFLPCSLQAQAKSPHESSKSARVFVQNFYNWYVPIQGARDYRSAWLLILKSKKPMFSQELIEAIGNDIKAQDKSDAEGGDIVGIDWDPFLSTQDPAEHYVAGNVYRKAGNYRIAVHRVESGKKLRKPDVVVELAFSDGHWMFINFHTPGNGDLLSALKLLREERQNPGASAPSAH
jgi:hypothetical protein